MVKSTVPEDQAVKDAERYLKNRNSDEKELQEEIKRIGKERDELESIVIELKEKVKNQLSEEEEKKSKKGGKSVKSKGKGKIDNSEILALKDQNSELMDENSELKERIKNLMASIKDKNPDEVSKPVEGESQKEENQRLNGHIQNLEAKIEILEEEAKVLEEQQKAE